MNFVSVDAINIGDTGKLTVGTVAIEKVFHGEQGAYILHNAGTDTAFITTNGEVATIDDFELRENERITINLNRISYIAVTGTTLKYTRYENA